MKVRGEKLRVHHKQKSTRLRYFPGTFQKILISILSFVEKSHEVQLTDQLPTPVKLNCSAEIDKTCLGLDILYLLSFSET
jgi:hypothetical protein